MDPGLCLELWMEGKESFELETFECSTFRGFKQLYIDKETCPPPLSLGGQRVPSKSAGCSIKRWNAFVMGYANLFLQTKLLHWAVIGVVCEN